MDDPAFDIDMALPALDIGLSNLELAGDSQRSTHSMMSIPHARSGSISSHEGSAIGLNLPSSSTPGGAYQLPLDDRFGGSSGQKPFGGRGRDIFDEPELFEDDMVFEFDEDGNLRDVGVNEREARHASSVGHHVGLGR